MASPDTADIRPYLTSTYSDEEITVLCADYFRDVADNFAAGMTKGQKIQLLLDHCQRRDAIPNLLAALQKDRSEQYRKQFGAAAVEAGPAPAPRARDPRQIFISHAHEDAEFAHRLAADLQAHGWRVWIVPDSIRPGEKWVEAINRGLEECGVFILVLTPAAVQSPWVKSETNAAIASEHQRELRLIPVELAVCHAPMLWNAYQRIPFIGRYSEGLKTLLAELDGSGVRSPTVPAPQPKRLPGWPWSAVGGAAVLLIAIILALRSYIQNPTTATPTATQPTAAQVTFNPSPAPMPTFTAVLLTPTQTRTPMAVATSTPTSVTTSTSTPIPTPTKMTTLIPTPMPTGTPTPTWTVTTTPKVGRVDLDKYCKRKYGENAYAKESSMQDAYTWSCYQDGERLGGITMDEACWVENQELPKAVMRDRQDAYSWYCTKMVSDMDGMILVYVPAGEFPMGSSDIDGEAFSYEKPQHKVYLDAFWIDRTEVTNAQYRQCVATGTCQPPSNSDSSSRSSYYGNAQYDNYPVIFVSWTAAQKYCAWAGRRLPTEAEWEKAARGTDGRKYPWGNDAPDVQRGNFSSNRSDTTVVGSYPTGISPYGALDMAGNVGEWVADWYDLYSQKYYADTPSQNPTGPVSGLARVLRGGSWGLHQQYARSACRGWAEPSHQDDGLGFRCVRSP